MKLAFIGLGRMGSAMVKRLLSAGHDVTVYNRTISKAEPLAKLGANVADSINECAEDNSIILSCLMDDSSVIEASKILLESSKPGLIHTSLATIKPNTAKQLEEMHEEHQCHYVSAAVLGVPKVADEGMLTTFCSGNETAIETVTPFLQKFSKMVIPLGDQIHAANVMKISMNYSLITAIELISELYAFAEKNNVDTNIIQMGLHEIYGHPAFKRYIDKIHDREFDEVNFSLTGGKKDVNLFQEAFNSVGVSPGIANLVKSRFDSDKANTDLQDKDWCSIYEVVREESGLD